MKRKILFFPMLVFVFLIGSLSAHAQTTPVDFNDKLVSTTDSLYKKGQDWGAKFKEVNESKNFKELAPYRLALQKFCDKKIVELKKTKSVGKGGAEFLKVMINFLNVEKGLIASFLPFEKFNDKTTAEVINAAIEKLRAESKKEEAELQKVTVAQEEYAKKNGFTVESAQPEPDSAEKDKE